MSLTCQVSTGRMSLVASFMMVLEEDLARIDRFVTLQAEVLNMRLNTMIANLKALEKSGLTEDERRVITGEINIFSFAPNTFAFWVRAGARDIVSSNNLVLVPHVQPLRLRRVITLISPLPSTPSAGAEAVANDAIQLDKFIHLNYEVRGKLGKAPFFATRPGGLSPVP